jgi:anaerobic selenocysteine-containing dehydrogenase
MSTGQLQPRKRGLEPVDVFDEPRYDPVKVDAGQFGHARHRSPVTLCGLNCEDGVMTVTEQPAVSTHFRTCPLCEATCGLEITVTDGAVSRIRGDRDDVYSNGFICPKGSTIDDLDRDPDRITVPMIRTGTDWREVSWAEAFAEIDRRFTAIRTAHGNDAVAVYIGNPSAHNLSSALYSSRFIRALRTKNRFSASTVDQMPKQVSSALMFGGALTIPLPDVERTSYLLMLGANPYDSNGSLLTAPDLPGRLEAMRERGGKLVVVDPRRSKTADHADEWVGLRPGTDAAWLLAIVQVLFADNLVQLGRRDGGGVSADLVNGVEAVRAVAADFSPERVAAATGVPAAVTRRIAHELSAAPSAAVYGRIGTCTQEFGTLSSWLIDVVNVLTGNLDRPGGAMFAQPATSSPFVRSEPTKGRTQEFGRFTSRVSGKSEFLGEFPCTTLPEEIETPGEGQVRALFTLAGNPVLSNPDSNRIDAALATLELMVSVDIYLNETSKHAHVFLPASRILTRSHYDYTLYNLAIRSVANWSAPVFPAAEGEMHEWEIMLRLGAIAAGLGADVDVDQLDDDYAREVAGGVAAKFDRTADDVLAMVSHRRGPDRILDMHLRAGAFGDHFGSNPGGLSIDVLEANPHGIDYGGLQPRIEQVLRTASGKVELAPTLVIADVARLAESLDRLADGSKLLLTGRRHVRSNNSWMHNVRILMKGKSRCTMHINPSDATRLGLVDGGSARVSSRSGAIEIAVEVTDSVMAGVVSIPHGFGHGHQGARMGIAADHAGANTNIIVPGDVIDPLSGNGVLTGIPVDVVAVS